MSDKLLDQIFNLKFTSKQLARSAIKCEKEQASEKLKVKKAIEKGNMEGAKIYAQPMREDHIVRLQNAIRKKSEQLNYMKLSSRLDAVVSKLDTQAKMSMVNKNFAGIVKSLEKSLEGGNLEKIATTMNQFERQFETLDLQASVVNDMMGAQAAMSTPEDEVNSLIMQVAEQHGLEVALNMPNAVRPAPVAAVASSEQDLGQRLAELRSK